MLPRPLSPSAPGVAPSAPRGLAGLTQPNDARRFKVLQSRGAPAQRSLFGPLVPPPGRSQTG